MTIQRFYKLRLLDLTSCSIWIVEFFLRKCWKKLSWLCLDWFDDMGSPCAIEAIGFCTGLQVLQMRHTSMQELPTSIGKLVHLLELDLSYCNILQSLLHEIGHLKRLKRLQLSRCFHLKEVLQSIS